MKPTIHFMHGFVASGKSTFAKKLAADKDIRRLNIDDMYVEKYGSKADNQVTPEIWSDLHKQLWQEVADSIASGKDIIVDLGHWSKGARNAARDKAEKLGANHVFYNIITDEKTALERLAKRNIEQPNMYYPTEKYMERKQFFDPISEDEEFVLIKN